MNVYEANDFIKVLATHYPRHSSRRRSGGCP